MQISFSGCSDVVFGAKKNEAKKQRKKVATPSAPSVGQHGVRGSMAWRVMESTCRLPTPSPSQILLNALDRLK